MSSWCVGQKLIILNKRRRIKKSTAKKSNNWCTIKTPYRNKSLAHKYNEIRPGHVYSVVMDGSGKITSFFKMLPKGAHRPPIRWSEPRPKQQKWCPGRPGNVAASQDLSSSVAATDHATDADNEEESSHEEDRRDEDTIGQPPKRLGTTILCLRRNVLSPWLRRSPYKPPLIIFTFLKRQSTDGW